MGKPLNFFSHTELGSLVHPIVRRRCTGQTRWRRLSRVTPHRNVWIYFIFQRTDRNFYKVVHGHGERTHEPSWTWALVQFCTGPKPDGIKHTVAHTIVLCMHQQRFIPSVIGPVRNCTSAPSCSYSWHKHHCCFLQFWFFLCKSWCKVKRTLLTGAPGPPHEHSYSNVYLM